MSFSVRIENLDAVFRDRVRLGRLRDGGARVVARAASTLKRRLVPFAKRDIGAEYNLPAREIGKRLRARGDESSVTLTGIGRPHFWDRARYFGEEQRLATALEAMEKRAD